MAVKDTALHMFGARCIFSFTHCLSMVNLFLSDLCLNAGLYPGILGMGPFLKLGKYSAIWE